MERIGYQMVRSYSGKIASECSEPERKGRGRALLTSSDGNMPYR